MKRALPLVALFSVVALFSAGQARAAAPSPSPLPGSPAPKPVPKRWPVRALNRHHRNPPHLRSQRVPKRRKLCRKPSPSAFRLSGSTA